MEGLTGTQLALLRLILANPGPSIEEMYYLAPLYGASRETLRADYIVLLKELLVSPVASIDRRYYLPRYCLITEKGKRVLWSAPKEAFKQVLPRKDYIFGIFEEKMPEFEEVVKGWPTFDECSNEEIELLANVYLYWAKCPPASHPLISKDELFWMAARGFARLNNIDLFSESLIGCLTDLKTNKRWELLFGIIFRALREYSNLEDVILSCASRVLAEVYLRLMKRPPPDRLSKEAIIKLVNKFLELGIIIP